MAVLTQNFLQSLGIELDETTLQAFSDHFETTLFERVVESILDELSDDQLTELSTLREQNDEQLQSWLQANIPNLSEIIQDEVDILLGDLAEDSEKF
ncbi:hypothetical protein KC953_00430 [Candidatus Saccharibacteria bacterium]|nr:hypothetical protein [Candidatus Saccharibacteria bacterium]